MTGWVLVFPRVCPAPGEGFTPQEGAVSLQSASTCVPSADMPRPPAPSCGQGTPLGETW